MTQISGTNATFPFLSCSQPFLHLTILVYSDPPPDSPWQWLGKGLMPSWVHLPSSVKKLSNWGSEGGLLASNSLAAHPVIIWWMTRSFISFEILISHSAGIFPRSTQPTNSCYSLIELLGLGDYSNWGLHLCRYMTQPGKEAKVNSALACPGSGGDLSIKQEKCLKQWQSLADTATTSSP